MKSKQLNISIDSTFLKRDRTLSKSDMLYLKELSELKFIKLHFPFFIYKECISDNIFNINNKIDVAISSLKNLERQGLHLKESKEFDKFSNELESKKDGIVKSVEKVWKDYIRESSAILHPFAESDSKVVFDNYFTGSSPFTSLKSRKDIPDAFILETLKKIAKDEIVHFVTADKNFQEKCALEKNIVVHSSLEDFYKSPDFEDVYKLHEGLKTYESSKTKLISKTIELKELIVDKFENDFEPKDIEDRYIPSDGNEGTITAIEHVSNIDLITDDVKFIDDTFYLQVVLTADCIIQYFIFIGDYYGLSDIRKVYVSDWNDHYYLAEESLEVVFKFNIKIPKSDLEDGSKLVYVVDDYDEIKVNLKHKSRI